MTMYHDRAAVYMALLDCFALTADEATEIMSKGAFHVDSYNMAEEYAIAECASAMYHFWDANRPNDC